MNSVRMMWRWLRSNKKRINRIADALLLALLPLGAVDISNPDAMAWIPMWFKAGWGIFLVITRSLMTFVKEYTDDDKN